MKTSFQVSFSDGSIIQVLAENALEAIRKAQRTIHNGDELICTDIKYKKPEKWISAFHK